MEPLYLLGMQVLHLPMVQYARHYAWFLFGVSGGFWFISWFLSHFALAIHDSLHNGILEELAELFAVAYNIFLAVLFSSIICLSIALAGADSPHYVWHQAAGFVFIYLILGAVYTDSRTREINEYSILGYYAGLFAYLGFAIRPQYLINPMTTQLYSVAAWIGHSWVGQLMSLYGIFRGASSLIRYGLELFSFQPAIKIRQVDYD